MPLLPEQNAARIAFFNSRGTLWASNAVAMGSSAAAVSAVASAVTAAQAALTAQDTAQENAKTATATLKAAMATLSNLGMTVVEQVRTKARSAGDSVYGLANLPEPATPTSVGNPGTPSDLVAELLPGGALSMTWKCANPPGCDRVIYQVYRANSLEADPTYIGGTGERKFVDAAIPTGMTTCVYRIQGTRTTGVGNAQEFIVRFGMAGSSGLSVEAKAPKLAA